MNDKKATVTKDEANNRLIVERTFDASRNIVWQGWTKAEHLKNWWGLKDWPVSYCSVDLRPGGEWRYSLKSPAGEERWVSAVYQEVDQPSRLIYTNTFIDESGQKLDSMPDTALVEVSFEDTNGLTRVTASFTYASATDFQAVIDMGMESGFTETLQNLASYITEGRVS